MRWLRLSESLTNADTLLWDLIAAASCIPAALTSQSVIGEILLGENCAPGLPPLISQMRAQNTGAEGVREGVPRPMIRAGKSVD